MNPLRFKIKRTGKVATSVENRCPRYMGEEPAYRLATSKDDLKTGTWYWNHELEVIR